MSTETIRVLIAEDEALIRLDLKEMLEEEGYAVVAEVGDGQQAVDRARELAPDLVILDIQMPVLDGLSAADSPSSTGIWMSRITRSGRSCAAWSTACCPSPTSATTV